MAKRVWQTPRAFSNWFSVLLDMAREQVGSGPETLTFRTRSGLTIECPNQPGTRVPLYEVFAEDCYHFNWFLGSLGSPGNRPLNVIDIGGQVGTFTCCVANLDPRATIHAYEPSPASAATFQRNVELNGFADRITVIEEAVAASMGTAEFGDNGSGSGFNSIVIGGRSKTATIKVQKTTFDRVVARMKAPVDFVKIDCEGGEYDLVLASSPASWDSVQRVVLEYHPIVDHSWAQLAAWFEDIGLMVRREEPFGEGYGLAWLSRDPLPPFAA